VRWRDSRENAEGDGCSSVNAAAAAAGGVIDFLFFVLFCFVLFTDKNNVHQDRCRHADRAAACRTTSIQHELQVLTHLQ
jgi:hypothetical protein